MNAAQRATIAAMDAAITAADAERKAILALQRGEA